MTVTLEARTTTTVTREARATTKMGDASSWKGFRLSQTHHPQTGTEHGGWGYKQRTMDLELEVTRLETWEVGSDEARNLRRAEQHKRMNTDIKL